MNQLFDKSNYNSLKNELIQCVENDLSWVEVLGKWHTSEETLDIVLSYDYTVTELCNEFGLPKEILQTVFLENSVLIGSLIRVQILLLQRPIRMTMP